jgi:hypothetical protein
MKISSIEKKLRNYSGREGLLAGRDRGKPAGPALRSMIRASAFAKATADETAGRG